MPSQARAMVGMIGLDVGLVLLHADNGSRIVARQAHDDDDDRPGSPAANSARRSCTRSWPKGKRFTRTSP